MFPSLLRKSSPSDTGLFTWFLIQNLALLGPREWKHTSGILRFEGPNEIELTDIVLLKSIVTRQRMICAVKGRGVGWK